MLLQSLHIATIIRVLESQRVNKQSNILDLTKTWKNRIIVRVLESQRVNKQSNILDLTKTDFFQLNLSQIHGKIG